MWLREKREVLDDFSTFWRRDSKSPVDDKRGVLGRGASSLGGE
jgi:hypothetical protein